MTSYGHTKRMQILGRKEAALQRLIDSAAPARKLIAAAEDVRVARIRVLRSRRAIVVPQGDADILYAKIDSKIQAISETTAASILAEFGVANHSCADRESGD